ncbi:MAG: protein kinase [Actinomycetota bacterium]|nr:protein kinase [Actinomycetota bacterium]
MTGPLLDDYDSRWEGLASGRIRLIDGSGLDAILRGGGPISPLRAVHLLTQVAQALDAAHAQGLVHRDVKPSNILVTRNDFAYLVDFGIARAVGDEDRMTTTGSAIGTAAYMAPERFDGGPPDRRCGRRSGRRACPVR